ncbi:cobaltochelatase subunit CobN [Kaistia dalseonensis]|uniref:Cobaltochelatase subunit CobN n=1 Tax=Kaistia dalseonensis TaxID=410840 RepID=A0ABU0H1Z8_9HYPH|nr:cobaltochelatase subunit CobN [Kaistia dalseonensis]MCX5493757.1 cobaltochelatase subunit CobN [Kaistia dalseonensis]MDQ0436321.1 cobaltochelatase CobN [Kaistia dalseonensis]
MHLVAGEMERIDDGGSAVDLDQSPGDIVILSAADSELAAFAAAASRAGEGPSLRLANLMRLSHPYSVDLYIEKTLEGARLVVIRMMGGVGYWPYGLEAMRKLARAGGPRLVVVPGEDRWDVGLEPFNTVPIDQARRIWRYCVEAGPENIGRALAFGRYLIGDGRMPPEAEPLPPMGFYRPSIGVVDEDAALDVVAGRPAALIVFYRALLEGGSTGPIDGLVAALDRQGIAAVPVFVTSLKNDVVAGRMMALTDRLDPAIVLNGTAFAISKPGHGHAPTVLDRPGRPVLQIVFAGTSRDAWAESSRGLGPRDLIMNVVLPEVDGRILTRPVSFKEEIQRDDVTDSRIVAYRPDFERIDFVARQAAGWVRLGGRRASERRIALVLSNYPDRNGRIGNGVGLDTPESATRIAGAMEAAGYAMEGFPGTGRALMQVLLGGAMNEAVDLSSETLPSGPLPPSGSVIPGEAQLRPGTHAAVSLAARAIDASAEWVPGQARDDGTGEGGGHFAEAGQARPSPHPLPQAGEGVRAERVPAVLPLEAYRAFHDALPETVRAALADRWGAPEADPHFADGAFQLAIHRYGNVVVGIQPARGYGIDPKSTYHDPDLVPPHHYLAFYAWLRTAFAADAIVHVGKHGNLEWLPGKALGLSCACWPEVALGPTPLIYPFIVNDPGEGAQAKRRSSAVIIDHLMPALTRAEAHGAFAELETLIDEYQLALGADPRRRDYLEREILDRAARHGIDRDLNIGREDTGKALRAIDAHLCDIKELQIRDGLHIFGASPLDEARIDTLLAIARVPRSGGRPENGSLTRAIAADLGLGGFDPLACDLGAEWDRPKPQALAEITDAPWRTEGDAVERIEMLAKALVRRDLPPLPEGGRAGEGDRPLDLADPASSLAVDPDVSRPLPGVAPPLQLSPLRGERVVPASGPATAPILDWIASDLAPSLDRSGGDEIAAVLTALDGRFVPPGPSGAPSRGRPDVLPTGRNFYAVDTRAVPTEAAWRIGKLAAEALVMRYMQDEGEWPRSVAISAWGTANMRTGGDDIAQVLALIGAEPVWEAGTGRVTGFRVLTLSELRRPRVDVTLRISGMFRDAFPEQIDLIDSAVRVIAAREEPDDANPIAAARHDGQDLARIFGAKPGAYGAGLQAMIDGNLWEARDDLAEAFVAWGGFAYGAGVDGAPAADHLRARLAATDAVLQNQDNREHDILDSDDYYQFQGGLSATVEMLKGRAPRLYHGDHARPENPVVRPLSEEIGRVVRGRAINPKWIAGCMRHGYKGAFEMAATLDFLFAFAATTNAVGDHHFDALYDAYLVDDTVRDFIADVNAPALSEMAERFRQAIDRGLWAPRLNSAYDHLARLTAASKETA